MGALEYWITRRSLSSGGHSADPLAGDDRTACGWSGRRSALADDPPRLRNMLPANLHPRIPEQHARGVLGGARHRRVVPHQILRDRPVDEKLELRRETFRVGDAELHQQIAKPEAAAFLEGDGDLLDRAILGAEFGDRVDERAAAKTLTGKTPLQPIERSQNLFHRRLVRRGSMREAALQVGRYQRVLGGKVVIERA